MQMALFLLCCHLQIYILNFALALLVSYIYVSRGLLLVQRHHFWLYVGASYRGRYLIILGVWLVEFVLLF